MTKVGIGSAYKEIDKIWVGIGGAWKEVDKAWVGIGGVWKEMDGLSKLLKYLGTITPLQTPRWDMGFANVGNYLLFAGGATASSLGQESDVVEAYNTSAVRSNVTSLTNRGLAKGASIGNVAIIASGYAYSGAKDTVDSYNASLTKGTATPLSEARPIVSAGTDVYALFVTGTAYSDSVLDAYNTSLVRSTKAGLSANRQGISGTDTKNYTLFGGGAYSAGNYPTVVDAFNNSLIRSNPTGFSVARESYAAARVGNFAIFAGGQNGSTRYATVDAYNDSLTKVSIANLLQATARLRGISSDYYALFAGGVVAGSPCVAYDSSLVRTNPPNITGTRYDLTGGLVGNYMLFAGGLNTPGNAVSGVVDAYILE